MDTTDWAAQLGRRISQARRRARFTQKGLAEAAGVSQPWLARIERGRVSKYPYDTLTKLQPFIDIPDNSTDAHAPESLPLRVPVFRSGARGDPRDQEDGPDADHEECPPVGRESLVGPRGFGVLIYGEGMADCGMHDGDTAWVNPDRPKRAGRPVAALLFARSGEELGLAVKVWRHTSDGDELVDGATSPQRGVYAVRDGEPLGSFEVIGPVVGISPAFRLPSGG